MTLPQNPPKTNEIQGILLVDKPRGKTSFSLVGALRKRLGVKKIGHAGTLDPFATGVVVMLVGRNYTRLSDQFLCQDKEYTAEIHFGETTDTYDCDGQVIRRSEIIPSKEELENIIKRFQGEVDQTPPMYSAKKVNGKKLYELARQGTTIERKSIKVKMETLLIDYNYPFATIHVTCSKGTYIRSIANDIGDLLGCGAHLSQLKRIRSGCYHLDECVDGSLLNSPDVDIVARLKVVDIPSVTGHEL